MSRRNLVGVLARSLHEAVCQELVGPVPFEGEPDRVRAEMVLLRLADNGYAVEARQQGRDRDDEAPRLREALEHFRTDGHEHPTTDSVYECQSGIDPCWPERVRAALDAGPQVRGGG